MKLYTEEQVRKMIEKSRETGLTAEYLTLTTKGIELPTDEEIDKKANKFKFELNKTFFKEGAKWVIEQIKQQSNGSTK